MASTLLHPSYPTVHLACDGIRPRVLEGAGEPTLRCSPEQQHPATIQVLVSRDQAWCFLTYVRLQQLSDGDAESTYGLKVPCNLRVEPHDKDLTLGVVGVGPACDKEVPCVFAAVKQLRRDPMTVLGHCKGEFPEFTKGQTLLQGHASATKGASVLTEVHVPMAVIAHLFEEDARLTHMLFDMDVNLSLQGDVRLMDHGLPANFAVYGEAA